MNRTLSKTDRTRMHIIESTADLFNKKGYSGTSLNDMIEASGLTKGSIYGNFKNKEEVALAVFDYNCSRISELTAKQINSATSYQSKLMAYVKVYSGMVRGSGNSGGCPILNTAVEADDTMPSLKLLAAKAIICWKKNMIELIEQGIAAGEFRQRVDPKESAIAIISLIEGGVMVSRVTGNAKNMDIVVNTIELLIRLIKE